MKEIKTYTIEEVQRLANWLSVKDVTIKEIEEYFKIINKPKK